MTTQPSKENTSVLLAHILDDTRQQALQEEKDLQKSLDARREAERQREDTRALRKRQNAEQRLREEAERQRQVRHTRDGLFRQLNGPSEEELEAERRAAYETKRTNEFQQRLEQAESARRAAEARAAEAAREAVAREEQHRHALAHLTPQSTPKRLGAAVWFVSGTAVVALLLGAFAAVAFMSSTTQAPERVYAKVVYAPEAVDNAAVEYGFVAEPTALAVPEVVTTEAPKKVRGKHRKRVKQPSKVETKKRSGSRWGDLSGGEDVFGSGKE